MSPWRATTEGGHNWRFLVIMAYLIVVTLATSYAIKQNSDANDKLRQQALNFANQQCVSSNKAKKVVYDLLTLAEDRIKEIKNPAQTPEQKAQALDFYGDAKKQITFVHCPPKPAKEAP